MAPLPDNDKTPDKSRQDKDKASAKEAQKDENVSDEYTTLLSVFKFVFNNSTGLIYTLDLQTVPCLPPSPFIIDFIVEKDH